MIVCVYVCVWQSLQKLDRCLVFKQACSQRGCAALKDAMANRMTVPSQARLLGTLWYARLASGRAGDATILRWTWEMLYLYKKISKNIHFFPLKSLPTIISAHQTGAEDIPLLQPKKRLRNRSCNCRRSRCSVRCLIRQEGCLYGS